MRAYLELEVNSFWAVGIIDYGYLLKISDGKDFLEIKVTQLPWLLTKREIIGTKNDTAKFKSYGDFYRSAWSRWNYSDMRSEQNWMSYKENITVTFRFTSPNEINKESN